MAAKSKTAKGNPEGVWDRPSPGYFTETRTLGEDTFTVMRRRLTFPEEQRILAKVINHSTRQPDRLELLALTVETAVRENNFGLTPERVRTMLADKPELAWFLVKWLCRETLENAAPDAEEKLRKNSGP